MLVAACAFIAQHGAGARVVGLGAQLVDFALDGGQVLQRQVIKHRRGDDRRQKKEDQDDESDVHTIARRGLRWVARMRQSPMLVPYIGTTTV